MGVKYVDEFGTTLAAGITDTDLTAQLVSVTGLPDVSGAGDYFYITFTDDAWNREVVKVTDVTGSVLTMERAQSGSTARAFSAGSKAEMLLCSALLSDLVDQLGNELLLGGAAKVELSIAGGVITPTRARHQVDTEADAASDDLGDILVTNMGAGSVILLSCVSASRAVVVKHNAGGAANPILLSVAADLTLSDPNDVLVLERDGGQWKELGRLGPWVLDFEPANADIVKTDEFSAFTSGMGQDVVPIVDAATPTIDPELSNRFKWVMGEARELPAITFDNGDQSIGIWISGDYELSFNAGAYGTRIFGDVYAGGSGRNLVVVEKEGSESSVYIKHFDTAS